jgi:hypothetical protein
MSRKKKGPIDWTAAVKRAKRERDRNTARIEAGETFRGHQHSSRKAPGQNKG